MLLNKAENANKIRGVNVARGSTTINHFLFVDNSIIFCRANLRELQEIQKIFET